MPLRTALRRCPRWPPTAQDLLADRRRFGRGEDTLRTFPVVVEAGWRRPAWLGVEIFSTPKGSPPRSGARGARGHGGLSRSIGIGKKESAAKVAIRVAKLGIHRLDGRDVAGGDGRPAGRGRRRHAPGPRTAAKLASWRSPPSRPPRRRRGRWLVGRAARAWTTRARRLGGRGQRRGEHRAAAAAAGGRGETTFPLDLLGLATRSAGARSPWPIGSARRRRRDGRPGPPTSRTIGARDDPLQRISRREAGRAGRGGRALRGAAVALLVPGSMTCCIRLLGVLGADPPTAAIRPCRARRSTESRGSRGQSPGSCPVLADVGAREQATAGNRRARASRRLGFLSAGAARTEDRVHRVGVPEGRRSAKHASASSICRTGASGPRRAHQGRDGAPPRQGDRPLGRATHGGVGSAR